MLETLRNDSQGQRLNFGHRLVPVLPIAQHAGQGRHFSQPAAVGLALQLDGESHRSTVYPQSAAQQAAEADGELALRPPDRRESALGRRGSPGNVRQPKRKTPCRGHRTYWLSLR